MANMNFGVNLLPKANNTYSLGNSDYKWLINGMALASACTKDVDNVITANTTSTNLPTSQAVASFVSGLLNNPVITGSLSLGRSSGSTVGTDSVALGDHVVASGAYTIAGGSYTVANHKAQTVLGEYNSLDASLASASSRGNYVLIVGNGTADNARSDALTLDWEGNLRIKGSVYVGANADGSGGTQISTHGAVDDVQINGTTILSNGIANIPCAGDGMLGVVRGNPDYGVLVTTNGLLAINCADGDLVKAGVNAQKPLVPYFQHTLVYYGLSKLAGVDLANETVTVGTYPETSKTAIRNLIGAGTYSLPSGGIPSTDLTSTVQTSLGLADSAYQLPSGGIPATDLASTVQTSLGLADTAYQLPSGGIPATDIASGVIPDVSGKADRVTGATSGNFASLDSNGNLTDSGSKASDFLTSHQDISGKADKSDTVLLTTLSRGRKSGTTVGTGSLAFGSNVTATGLYSVAIGDRTEAIAGYSFAMGSMSKTLRGAYSFSGGLSTSVYGDETFAFGESIVVYGSNCFAFGKYNEKDLVYINEWVSGTAYVLNDIVIHDGEVYVCIEPNSDETFDESKWTSASTSSNFAEVVGGGSAFARKTIRSLDWSGNLRIKGNLYVNANDDGTGGYALISDTDTVLKTTLSRGRKANTTVGTASIAFGNSVEASGDYSVALGYNSKASNDCAFAVGSSCNATGQYSVAMGWSCDATAWGATSFGYDNLASGLGSTACCRENTASGACAFASGHGNIAKNNCNFVFGEYATQDTSSNGANARGNFIEIVGNGTSDSLRSNARTLDWNGNMQLAGDITLNAFGNAPLSLANRVVPFTGATSDSGGSMGLVPAPASGQTTKFLRSDGSWQYVAGLRDFTSLTKGTKPSSNTYYLWCCAYETRGTADANRLGYLTGYVTTAGNSVTQISAQGFANGSAVICSIGAVVNYDGTLGYYLTSPEAFRNAISAVKKGCTWKDLKGT